MSSLESTPMSHVSNHSKVHCHCSLKDQHYKDWFNIRQHCEDKSDKCSGEYCRTQRGTAAEREDLLCGPCFATERHIAAHYEKATQDPPDSWDEQTRRYHAFITHVKDWEALPDSKKVNVPKPPYRKYKSQSSQAKILEDKYKKLETWRQLLANNEVPHLPERGGSTSQLTVPNQAAQSYPPATHTDITTRAEPGHEHSSEPASSNKDSAHIGSPLSRDGTLATGVNRTEVEGPAGPYVLSGKHYYFQETERST
ncbi:uncharacterized protein I206_106723 [Kwoniella pini CBS 10737]|uniref:Uncharacterized protein n=1 Tax=Kwoniella pini CBS 10737 TaxID=1296096 RepID=A0A1B9HTD8_9TREE|nr:uncharacterized protein I206_07388 [Kwoniella pini CBS 10737]OCF46535.1 hypothetical protein I206_07388 [Kwoniella pini CBS 10737]